MVLRFTLSAIIVFTALVATHFIPDNPNGGAHEGTLNQVIHREHLKLPKLTQKAYAEHKTVSAVPVSPQDYIQQAALEYGVDPNHLLRVAKCESNFNLKARNASYYAGGGNPTGLFQYIPSTWESFKKKAGVPNGDIYSARDQARVTAWAFKNGLQSHWECR